VTLNAVARKKKCKNLAIQFIVSQGIEMDTAAAQAESKSDVPADKDHCGHVEEGTLRRCTGQCGHRDKHRFVTNGTISVRKAEELFKILTADEWKSLAGQDDKALELGKENFEKCRDITKKYFDAGEDQKKILKRIDDHEVFCQTDLRCHFKNVSCHSGNCLTCGFFEKGKRTSF
jgi:hypothetical protein